MHIYFFLWTDIGYAQHLQCGFQEQFKKSSQNGFFTSEIDRILKQPKKSQYTGYREKWIIPVVVHIVHFKSDELISDNKVLSQIEQLNRDFSGNNIDIINIPEIFKVFANRNSKINFCLANVDIEGNSTSGILRTETHLKQIGTKGELYRTSLGGSDAWDTDKYLNIWVADTGDFVTGFGTYPTQVSDDKHKQGVVVNSKYFDINDSKHFNLGRVVVHEVGHYLGLKHIWGDSENCISDDGVEDTPSQKHSYEGCPKSPQKSCTTEDMFMMNVW